MPSKYDIADEINDHVVANYHHYPAWTVGVADDEHAGAAGGAATWRSWRPETGSDAEWIKSRCMERGMMDGSPGRGSGAVVYVFWR